MSPLQIALTITVPALIAVVTTWINIRIRFAKDAAQAMSEAKSDFKKAIKFVYFWIILPVSYAYVIGTDIYLFCTAPWPLERGTFAWIIFETFFIFTGFLTLWLKRIADTDRDLISCVEALDARLSKLEKRSK